MQLEPVARAEHVELLYGDRWKSFEPLTEAERTDMLRAGVAFSYSCQAGNCGSCKCEYVEGEIYELEYSEHALSEAERARRDGRCGGHGGSFVAGTR